MAGIKHKIAISGGKGSVGKSLVTVNLGAALAMMGSKVAILDQDFGGSTVPKMFAIQGIERSHYGINRLIPAEDDLGLEIKIMSLALVYRMMLSASFTR